MTDYEKLKNIIDEIDNLITKNCTHIVFLLAASM